MSRKGNVYPTVEDFGKLTPFSSYELYGDKKYSLQNMVLKMVNFPAKYEEGVDVVHSVYSDRAYTEWGAAASLIESTESGDAWFHGVSDEDFLLFAGKLFAAINTRRKCTGDALTYRAYQYENQYMHRYKELYGSIALSGMWRGREDTMQGEEYSKFLRLSIETDKWAQKQAMEEIEPLKITGALMIRMTNVSSGYPCPIILAIEQKSKQPLLTVSYPGYGRGRMDPFGQFEDEYYSRRGF